MNESYPLYSSEQELREKLKEVLKKNNFRLLPIRNPHYKEDMLDVINFYFVNADIYAYKNKKLYVIELKNMREDNHNYKLQIDMGIVQILRYVEELDFSKIKGYKLASIFSLFPKKGHNYHEIKLQINEIIPCLIISHESLAHRNLIKKYNLPIKMIVYNGDCPFK